MKSPFHDYFYCFIIIKIIKKDMKLELQILLISLQHCLKLLFLEKLEREYVYNLNLRIIKPLIRKEFVAL